MPGNTIGNIFRLTTYGESHGHSVGGIVDGCPAGLNIDTGFILRELDRRRPFHPGSTPRREPDHVEFLSGILNNITLGTPIAFQVRNLQSRSEDYAALADIHRPSHADLTYDWKYGLRDYQGGGRASGRETVARVVGGAIAKLLLKILNIEIMAIISQVGDVEFLDSRSEKQMISMIREADKAGDTLGGSISCVIKGAPPGWGEPVFDKLQADLAKAMLSIGSAKAFEYGLGFQAATLKGSGYNDQMTSVNGQISFLTNHDGGIQGGISNGQDIYFRVGFKPVPSVKTPQKSVDKQGNPVMLKITGRHDSCHIPRLVVVVESMAAIVLADHFLRNAAARMDKL